MASELTTDEINQKLMNIASFDISKILKWNESVVRVQYDEISGVTQAVVVKRNKVQLVDTPCSIRI
jgi:hypothetical protein